MLFLGVFQLFRLIGSGKGVDDLVQIPVHNGIDALQGQTHSVVGDPTLREVVGADALVAHTGAHL